MLSTKEVASYSDKIRYADTWILIVKRASLARLERRSPEYYRCIETLILILFKEQRNKSKAFLQHLKETMSDEDEIYDLTLSYIIDELHSSGYLTKASILESGGGAKTTSFEV